MQVFDLPFDPNAKMRRYTSIYSKDYLLAKAEYEARRKNWEVRPISENRFLITDSSGLRNQVFWTWYVKNCDCKEFFDTEIGQCQHTFAIEIHCRVLSKHIKSKTGKLLYVNYPDGGLVASGNGRWPKAVDPNSLDKYPNHEWSPSVSGFLATKTISKRQRFQSPPLDYTLPGVTLYGHQKPSVDQMLANKRTILTLKVGLGKTVCALYCTRILDNLKKIVVICPNSLKFQWQKEINRFNLGTSLVISKGDDLASYKDQRFLIVTYEMVTRHIETFCKTWDIAIIDEIQKIKNSEGKTWEAIQRLEAEFIFGLSGTPIQNTVSDIISILRIVAQNEFHPEWRFYERFCNLSRTRISGLRPDALPELKTKLKEYIINPKINPSDFKMPKEQEHVIQCTLDKIQQDIHDPNMDQAKVLLSISAERPLTFAERAALNGLLTKARRAVSDARLFTPENPKSDRFRKIEELIYSKVKQGKKVVVYSEWIDCLNLLATALYTANVKYVCYTGELSDKARNRNLETFIEDPETKVFLSTDAGGLGVDGLQLASSTVIHVEDIWNPMKLKQRNGRLVRMLQREDVVDVYYMQSTSGIEAMMAQNKVGKYQIISELT